LRIVHGKLRDRQKRSIEKANQEIDNNPNVGQLCYHLEWRKEFYSIHKKFTRI